MMNIYCILIILFVQTFNLQASQPQQPIEYDAQELFYWSQNNVIKEPVKDPIFGGLTTLNKQGANYYPNDVVSKAFFADIMTSKNPDVCEIGCAFGLLAQKTLENKKDITYTAIDLDKEHLAHAVNNIKNLGDATLKNFHPVQARFPQVNFNKTFSHIGTFLVFHFMSPQEITDSLKRIEALLNKGGKAYILTAHYDSPSVPKLLSLWYTMRYWLCYPFPGYVGNIHSFINIFLKLGLLPQRITKESSFIDSIPESMLLFNEDGFKNLVKRVTNLKICQTVSTLTTMGTPDAPLDIRHVGIILEKVN